MTPKLPSVYDESDAIGIKAEAVEQASEDDLLFLPGPMEEEPDYFPPGLRAVPSETAVLDDWQRAEAGNAAVAFGSRFQLKRLAET